MYVKGSTLSFRRLHAFVNVTLALVMLFGAALVSSSSSSEASSHREAPLISQDPIADNTDTWFFVSPTNPDNVVLVGSWIPFEGPEGAPNYFEWGKGILYDMSIDNDGDAKPDVVYTLSSSSTVVNPTTFLYNVGPIQADGTNWNKQQRYTITEWHEDGSSTVLLDNVLAPPVNIGSKSTPNYKELSDKFIYKANDDGDEISVYAGQVDDAFWVDLQIFDLLTLRGQAAPIGYSVGNNDPVDSVAGFNNHSLVIEVPISRLRTETDPVLGMWATTRRPSTRVFKGIAGLGDLEDSGDPVQVSRLGMPLVNEVVLPYALKDAFNSLQPELDVVLYTGGAGTGIRDLLQNSVENPELGRLLCAFYGVPLPADANKDCNTDVVLGSPRSGRGDIFDIFLTGFKLAAPFTIQTKNGPVMLPAGFNVNQPIGVVPAEMIRLNTDIKGDLCSPIPSRLGVLGGDACGFPNGRRLRDDIVEIELAAVAGATYAVLDGRDTSFSFNPALLDILDDGIDFNDVRFRSDFPFVQVAQSGQEHIHDNPQPAPPMNKSIVANITSPSDDAVERNSGAMVRLGKQLELGQLGEKPQTVGLRFTGVEIPKGATIVNAYIEFKAVASTIGSASFKIAGEATDDAATFDRNPGNISARTKTSAVADWNNVEPWQADMKYWSSNIKSVVQEIVGRGGWVAGSDMAFFVTGTGERIAKSFDRDPNMAPMLYVEYSMGGSVAAAGADSSEEVSSVVAADVLNTAQPTDTDWSNIEPDLEAGVQATTKVFLPTVQK